LICRREIKRNSTYFSSLLGIIPVEWCDRDILQSICVALSSLLRHLSYSSVPYLFLSLPNKKQQACSSESISVLQLSSLAELSILSAAVEGKPADFAEPAE